MFLPGMSGQFNRRDFLRIGTLAATAPIFDAKRPHGLDFTLLDSPTPQKYLNLSASDKRFHFGLGHSNTAFTEVSWPSGACETLKDVPADQFLEICEPEHP
jgi:hypothetical protein